MKRGSHSWVHRSHDRKPYLESIAAFLNKELTQQLLFLSLWMSRSSLVSSRSSTFHLVTVLQVRWKDFFTFTLSLSQVPQEFTGDLFYLYMVFLLPQLQFAGMLHNELCRCFQFMFKGHVQDAGGGHLHRSLPTDTSTSLLHLGWGYCWAFWMSYGLWVLVNIMTDSCCFWKCDRNSGWMFFYAFSPEIFSRL
jgi:hypothetical protein